MAAGDRAAHATSRTRRLATSLTQAGALWLLLAYAAVALAPAAMGWRWSVAALSFCALWVAVGLCRRAGPGGSRWVSRAAVAALATVLSLGAADLAYHWYETRTGARRPADFSADLDTRLLAHAAERYYPTATNLQWYKPNRAAAGFRYGDLYWPAMLDCPSLATVPERRWVTYLIDRHGFRETTPRAGATIVVLGDSFAVGPTRQDLLWPKVLERRLGTPVYNLGVSGTGPSQQFLLLEHVLERLPEPPPIQHLLWMIFEGNDLEDGPGPRRTHALPERPQGLGMLDLLPWGGRWLMAEIRERSLLHRVAAGELSLGLPGAGRGAPCEKRFPGLHHSSRFSYKVFEVNYTKRVQQPRRYVDDHPNRLPLEQALRDMKGLADRFDFAVTVVIAPSDARLHGPHFETFPILSRAPHLIDHVARHARGLGFGVLDLYPLMRAPAERELLYYRDDTHWNERGNAVVADLVATRVFERPPPEGQAQRDGCGDAATGTGENCQGAGRK
jgi:hypothetical protein